MIDDIHGPSLSRRPLREEEKVSDRVKHTIDSIVAGTDFSMQSLDAVNWACSKLAPEAQCTLVHALEIPPQPRFLRGVLPSRDEVVERERNAALEKLNKLVEERGWSRVNIEVREGRPDRVIADVAKEVKADLVVVGEHARPRGLWPTLGSTAEALVRCAPVPVLLAREVPSHAPRHILVAIDDSEPALAALRWAAGLSRAFGAHTTVYHAFRPVYLNVAESVSGMAAAKRLKQDQLRQAEEWVDEQVRAVGFDPDALTVRVYESDPATGIISTQKGSDIDLIVMGSSGAGGAGRLILGSVADGVLRGASCSVLVVR